ncbi:MAG: ATP-binding cassette domain-containing protein [Desulfobacterales bacterium]
MAVKGVSLSVKHGQIIALIGANGSGKSTLLESICGLLPDWKGDITFEGTRLKDLIHPPWSNWASAWCPKGGWSFRRSAYWTT